MAVTTGGRVFQMGVTGASGPAKHCPWEGANMPELVRGALQGEAMHGGSEMTGGGATALLGRSLTASLQAWCSLSTTAPRHHPSLQAILSTR